MTNLRIFLLSLLRVGMYAAVLGVIAAMAGMYYVRWHILPQLPSTAHLKEVQMQMPLRIYTLDGQSIAEYGDERRKPLTNDEIPPMLVKSVLAIEDARFYEHHGVDFKGLARAALHAMKTGRIEQGGSTITMQLARNFFLGREQTGKRKLKEILLAWRIEEELRKEEIMALYLNKIFFGHRAYGIAAAAQVYYGKTVQQLTLAEMAMLAGIPKAPSANNPISNPERAMERRNYILKRMLELGYIQENEYQEALKAPNTAQLHSFGIDVQASYIAEMARAYVEEKYGKDNAYAMGLKVYTTVSARLQHAAQQALHNTLLEYERRHGYRGPARHIDLPSVAAVPAGRERPRSEVATEWLAPMVSALNEQPVVGGLIPAVVVAVADKSAQVFVKETIHPPQQGNLVQNTNVGAVVYPRPATGNTGVAWIPWEGLAWARLYRNENSMGPAPKKAADVLAVGDVIYIQPLEKKTTAAKDKKPTEDSASAADNSNAPIDDDGQPTAEPPPSSGEWQLAQVPHVAGALISIDAEDGAIQALEGGFDFYHSKFNRVTQAIRQPGSSFKPFIYSAALDSGYSPGTEVNDAPLVFTDDLGRVWRPENYAKEFKGWMPLRTALATSRNLVSIRIMRDVGIDKTLEHAVRFGFDRKRLPRNLTLALGTPELTMQELARGYAVFANGGFLVEPYFIARIEDSLGNVLEEAHPKKACRECDPPVNLAQATPESSGALPAATDANSPPGDTTLAPRVISSQNAWLMTAMLQDVVRYGTGARAKKALGRNDLAGKTGTTNDQKDAWFSGFNSKIVTTSWIGFDQPASLGKQETGARAALPMWIAYMREALKNQPETVHPQPSGIDNIQPSHDPSETGEDGDTEMTPDYFQNPSGQPLFLDPSGAPVHAPSGIEATDELF